MLSNVARGEAVQRNCVFLPRIRPTCPGYFSPRLCRARCVHTCLSRANVIFTLNKPTALAEMTTGHRKAPSEQTASAHMLFRRGGNTQCTSMTKIPCNHLFLVRVHTPWNPCGTYAGISVGHIFSAGQHVRSNGLRPPLAQAHHNTTDN